MERLGSYIKGGYRVEAFPKITLIGVEGKRRIGGYDCRRSKKG